MAGIAHQHEAYVPMQEVKFDDKEIVTALRRALADRVGAERLDFTYARSYLDHPQAISLYTPELPLRRGAQEPLDGLTVAACLKDATPDSWGERVIGNRLSSGDAELSVETYMLESGSNRLGAIDFQESPEEYRPRLDTASLDELYDAAEKVLAGEPLNPAIGDALMNGRRPPLDTCRGRRHRARAPVRHRGPENAGD